MTLHIFLAWLHLLALSAGLAGVWSRARALRDSLRDPEDGGALRRAFVGHAWWTLAALLLLLTGAWKLFSGSDGSSAYHFANRAFYLKLALVSAIVALEVWPTMTLIRWRYSKAAPNPRDAGRIEVISYVQCVIIAFVVLAAVTMARGIGAAGTTGGGAPSMSVSQPPPASAELSGDPPPIEPSGVESVTADDVALLTREIAMPLDGVDPTALRSSFDERRGGGTRQHQALDLMAARRTPIRSAAAGRVLKLFTSAAGGLMIYAADSSERFIMMYAHLDGYAPGLREGMALVRGQLIGYVGSTGNASPNSPHLHFAVARSANVKRWSKGKPIDPLPVLQAAAAARPVGP